MDSNESIEANKLIAEFMEKPITEDKNLYMASDIDYTFPDHLKYHSSWDWICPVMERIYSLGYTVQWTITDGSTCRIWKHRETIASCGVIVTDRPFTAVVQFITWYNQNKP